MHIKLLLLIFCIAVVSFSACKKNNDAPVVSTSIDSLNFVNASAQPFNIYLNGSRLINNSNLSIGGSSGYYTVPSGQQTYQVKKVFDPAGGVVTTLVNLPLNLAAHHYYSLFIPDDSASHAFTTIDTLRADTTGGTCLVRFVNASPASGSLDLSIGGVQYSNQAFKSVSGFSVVDTSSMSPIIINQSGTATQLINGHYPLLEGYIYTFYAKGSPNGTGNSALSVGVTVNGHP
jgi:hypothetical protein